MLDEGSIELANQLAYKRLKLERDKTSFTATFRLKISISASSCNSGFLIINTQELYIDIALDLVAILTDGRKKFFILPHLTFKHLKKKRQNLK